MAETIRSKDFEITHRALGVLDTLMEPSDLASLFTVSHPLPIDLPKYYMAFVHSSFASIFKGTIGTNERLEFLGDTVLGVLVSKRLFLQYPEFDEGHLSKLRAALVNEKGLYELSMSSKLYRFVLLGRGELKSGTRKQGILADLVEALLGATYNQEGIEASERLFNAFLENYRQEMGKNFIDPKKLESFDAKSSLQEKVVALYGTNPEYVDFEVGRQIYRIDLYVDGKKILTGKGRSKKKVQRELAEKAIKQRLYDKTKGRRK